MAAMPKVINRNQQTRPKLNLWVPMLVFFAMALVASNARAFADPLNNAFRQRIGNYDVQMTTEPKNPTVGSPSSILIRIAGVNGDDLVDVPITLRLVKDGIEVSRITQVVPYGHYVHEYTFTQSGRYVVYLDVNDLSYTGQTLTFTFFVNVAGAFDYLYIAALSAGVATAAIAGAMIFIKRKKQAHGIKS